MKETINKHGNKLLAITVNIIMLLLANLYKDTNLMIICSMCIIILIGKIGYDNIIEIISEDYNGIDYSLNNFSEYLFEKGYELIKYYDEDRIDYINPRTDRTIKFYISTNELTISFKNQILFTGEIEDILDFEIIERCTNPMDFKG